MVITSSMTSEEDKLLMDKEHYKSRVDCPIGYAMYRYTINSTDTKIPVGTFAEVPGSRYTSKVDANRVVPKKFLSNAFTFEVRSGESYRVFAKSNKDD